MQKVQSSISVFQLFSKLIACGKKLLPRRAPRDLILRFFRCSFSVYFLTRPTWRHLGSLNAVCYVVPCHRCHVFSSCFHQGVSPLKVLQVFSKFFSSLRFVIIEDVRHCMVRRLEVWGGNVFALPRDICCAANVYKNLLNRCYPTFKK